MKMKAHFIFFKVLIPIVLLVFLSGCRRQSELDPNYDPILEKVNPIGDGGGLWSVKVKGVNCYAFVNMRVDFNGVLVKYTAVVGPEESIGGTLIKDYYVRYKGERIERGREAFVILAPIFNKTVIVEQIPSEIMTDDLAHEKWLESILESD